MIPDRIRIDNPGETFMLPDFFLLHIGYGLFLFIVSVMICRLMIRRVRIMDVPNDRSAHARPTPKSGGVAIVVPFMAGMAVYRVVGTESMIHPAFFWGLVFSSVLLAGISFHDDIAGRPIVFKLTGQILAASMLMAFGVVLRTLHFPGIGELHLGCTGYPLTLLWVIGLTNTYNFMDGINGLAGGTAVFAALFLCIWSFYSGSHFVYIVCYSLIAGALGFLIHNFPKGRLFMGDVGSAFLGFVFAALAILASEYDQSRSSFFLVPLLLFHFIYDTVFTFVRRLKNRRNVFTAHREHLYQLFNRLGYSHVVVSLFHFGLCCLQGIGAGLMLKITGDKRVLVFMPFLFIEVVYSVVIMRKASKAGLI